MSEVRRVLRAWDRGDGLIGEWPIDALSLADLQELFGVEPDNPMYDSFRVTARQAAALSEATGVSIDLQRYAYFVEADAA